MINLSTRAFSVFAATLALAACGTDVAATGPVAADEIVTRIADGSAPVILDVRTPEEYAAGHVPGAINIQHDTIGGKLDTLPFAKDDEIAVYCKSGRRAGIAADALRAAGFTNVRDLTGHYLGWNAAGRPLETE